MRVFSYFLRLLQRASTSRHAFTRTLALATLSGVHQSAYAQAGGGLSKAKTTLEMLRDNLYIILPIVAVISGVVIFVLYSAEVMQKDTAVRWGIGVALCGSVGELVAMLWK